MASATNKKPLEFTRKTTEPKSNASEPRRKDFLFYLADGQSIEQACNLVGVTRKGYENWRRRHEEFPKLVEAARESYRRDIACGFHGADAYARMLLDAIQRDESLPAPLRYRASKTILTRKGKTDWLPDPIPADTEPLAPYDEEQPDYLTNDFPSQPARSRFESAESQTASPQASAPKASAANLTPEAGSQEPEAGQPLKPFTQSAPPSTPNPLQNQYDAIGEPREAAPPFSSYPFTSPATDRETASHGLPPHAMQAPAIAPKASAAANAAPEAGSWKLEAVRAPASEPEARSRNLRERQRATPPARRALRFPDCPKREHPTYRRKPEAGSRKPCERQRATPPPASR